MVCRTNDCRTNDCRTNDIAHHLAICSCFIWMLKPNRKLRIPCLSKIFGSLDQNWIVWMYWFIYIKLCSKKNTVENMKKSFLESFSVKSRKWFAAPVFTGRVYSEKGKSVCENFAIYGNFFLEFIFHARYFREISHSFHIFFG